MCDETMKVCGEQTWAAVIATEMEQDRGRWAAAQVITDTINKCLCVS